MTYHAEAPERDLVPPERLPYMPGIDGLRAIAVMAVLFYHADFTWARGGFLGVEVFFVISGYLITSLLLVEWLRTGTIGLKSFWIRRARRLLPAVFTLIIGVSIGAIVVYRDALDRMLGDVLAATAYITNWFLIVRDVSYFEAFGRPPLLQHLWSLSVEEQFYLLWPLIFSLGLALIHRGNQKRTIRSFLLLTIAGIVGSTLLMAFLFTPFEDPSRVYYGTDTRVAGILVGVALSLVWIPWRLPATLSPRQRTALNLGGIAALAALIVILVGMDEYSTLLYRGGFLLTSLVTAAVIGATVHPAGVLGKLLENPVMKWVGTRSYGIYLWHWPIFMVTRPGIDVADRPYVTFAVRTALTFVIAEVSYRYVESPIRQKGLRQWVIDTRRTAGIRTVRSGSIVAIAALMSISFILAGLTWGSITRDAGSVAVASGATEDVSLPPVIEATSMETSTTSTTPTTSTSSTTPTTSTSSTTPTTPTTSTTNAAPPEYVAVSMIGDSVLAGAQQVVENTLENPLVIDATISRQFKHADDVAEDLRASGTLADVVVLHLGTNGAFSSNTFDEVIESLLSVDRVLVLTAKVPRRWEASVNRTILEGAERWPIVEVIDWHTTSGQHPEWFNEDQVHLNGTGMRAYAELLSDVINDQ